MSNDRSILHRLEEQGQPAPRVSLEGSERKEKTAAQRYEIVGEIARGGVGRVHRGRDNDLGRDVALKVLLEAHLQTPELVQRFVEEAQIGGQLQHPGIVPVYELGLREGRRPFFAMKLVKGETLAARLARGESSRRELMAVFRDVCRTMAYAHARGVIHRDLKPSNVMIGNFGEVQVVDWGFAKVLRRGGIADEKLAKRAERATTMISTVRSGEGSEASVAGAVMGTPAYMPPEQALGRVDDLDERSDVFSLGAILCEILTGKPPYTDDRMHAAAHALLEPAYERLDACGADARLVDLCKRCLQPLPKDRPAKAEALADEAAAYLASAEGRAHRARVRTLKAGERAREQRRARRFTTLVGTSVVLALAVGAGAFFRVDAARQERTRERQAAIEAAVQDAERLRTAKDWPAALAAAQRAAELGDDGALAASIRLEAEEADRARTQRAEESRLLADLEDARAMGGGHYTVRQVDAAYRRALLKLWPVGEIDTARLRRSAHAAPIAAALDDWAAKLGSGEKHDRIDGWARAIDPDSNALRDAIAARDIARLESMLGDRDLGSLAPAMITGIARTLRGKRRHETALRLLTHAHRLHPDDFWIHMHLTWVAGELGEHKLALRHATAAVALRPDGLHALHWLGIELEHNGDLQGALEAWRKALALEPEWVHGMTHIQNALVRLGRKDEAGAFVDEMLRKFPKNSEAHIYAGQFQGTHLGGPEVAAETFRKALELDPGSTLAVNNLAWALTSTGRYDEAIELLEKAHETDPRRASLKGLGDAYRERAIRSRPPDWKDLRRAIDLLRRAVKKHPEDPAARISLGQALGDLRDRVPEAARELEKAVAQSPTSAHARRELGKVYVRLRKYEAAIEHLAKATELDPTDKENWMARGHAIVANGGPDEAVAAFVRSATAAATADPSASHAIGLGVSDGLGQHREAVAFFRRYLEQVDPDHAPSIYSLGTSLKNLGEYAEAEKHLRRAIELNPEDAQAYCNLGWCLRYQGRWPEALRKLKKGHALGMKRGHWPYPSPQWIATTRQMLALRPALERLLNGEEVVVSAYERLVLAEMALAKRRPEESVACYLQAFGESPGLERMRAQNAIHAAIHGGPQHHAQAIRWFRAWLERVRLMRPSSPDGVRRQIYFWKYSSWFAPVRDGDDIPEEWNRFWADAEALQQAARR